VSLSKVSIRLKALFPSAELVNADEIVVADATEQSDQVTPGSLFAAISGTRRNGEDFAREAVQRGAAALLLSRPMPDLAVPQCIVPDVRRAFAMLCDALAGHPSDKLKIAGVTGTNGKTTTTWMIRSILRTAGFQTGLLGTIEYHDGLKHNAARLTTPDSRTFSNWLAAMVACGTTHAAMELSSHALDQGRTCGTQLDVAIVTNVTQDHFDYHKGFEPYLAAKSRIAEQLKPAGVLVLNADDPGSASIARRVAWSGAVMTFGIEREADVTATLIEESTAGSRFVLGCGREAETVFTPLIGRHNVANALAAAAAAHHLGIPLQTISLGIELLAAVPGRLERVDAGQPFDVFVDFAHTEDALRRCVSNLRQLTSRRVIVVFGAGGDRDRSKRPKMANAVRAADLIVVTSDNPRTEDPQQIIEDILAGFAPSFPPLHVEADRRTAIAWALNQAQPGDCVLIAGKGHETEQIVGTQRFPFDDRLIARELLAESASVRGSLTAVGRNRRHDPKDR
jgi:UDP-N-acetylmuramoyl-L-alanyl-D-glutamate--2,6-diaminopimelate ligase